MLVVLNSISCKQEKESPKLISYGDTAVKLYLERNEYLNKNDFDFYERDSNSFDYKLLKGYYYRDSNFLKETIKQLKDPFYYSSSEYLDSFWKADIPILKNIQAEEAYQFQYSETFCPDKYIITITKDSSKIKLNSFIYQPIKVINEKLAGVQIIENKTKYLNPSDWEQLKDTLDYADFWNLKPANYDAVLDPSNLTIIGIKDNPYTVGEKRKTHSVSRTIFKTKAIYKSFLVARRLAEIQKVCGD